MRRARVARRLGTGRQCHAVPRRAFVLALSGSSMVASRCVGPRRIKYGKRGLSLVDEPARPEAAPAREWGELYARRWEHELYYREVKRQLRKTDLLHSPPPETGAQETAGRVLASAVLADERARAATGEVPVLRVSFGRVLRVATAIWVAIDLGAGILSDGQIAEII